MPRVPEPLGCGSRVLEGRSLLDSTWGCGLAWDVLLLGVAYAGRGLSFLFPKWSSAGMCAWLVESGGLASLPGSPGTGSPQPAPSQWPLMLFLEPPSLLLNPSLFFPVPWTKP